MATVRRPGSPIWATTNSRPGGQLRRIRMGRSRAAAGGQAYTAQNGYIGQTTPGISGQASVMPYAQQAAQYAQQVSPWLGQSSQQAAQVGPNAFGGGNPFLGQQIQQAQDETAKAWSSSVRPALDSAMRASGSFGNTAIQEQQNNAYNDLGKQLGGIASGMRMQDYTQQQQLAENALNRQQQVNLANSGLSAQDLSRNLSGSLQGQSLGLQGLGQALGAAQFDANLGNNVNQFNSGIASQDLTRNANLMQALGTFNAGQLGGMSQFNAQQGNALGQFSAGQRQTNNLSNAAAANSMLTQQRNLGQQQKPVRPEHGLPDLAGQQRQHAPGHAGPDQPAGPTARLAGPGDAGRHADPEHAAELLAAVRAGRRQPGGVGGTVDTSSTGTNRRRCRQPAARALGGWQLVSQLLGGGKARGTAHGIRTTTRPGAAAATAGRHGRWQLDQHQRTERMDWRRVWGRIRPAADQLLDISSDPNTYGVYDAAGALQDTRSKGVELRAARALLGRRRGDVRGRVAHQWRDARIRRRSRRGAEGGLLPGAVQSSITGLTDTLGGIAPASSSMIPAASFNVAPAPGASSWAGQGPVWSRQPGQRDRRGAWRSLVARSGAVGQSDQHPARPPRSLCTGEALHRPDDRSGPATGNAVPAAALQPGAADGLNNFGGLLNAINGGVGGLTQGMVAASSGANNYDRSNPQGAAGRRDQPQRLGPGSPAVLQG